MAAPPPLNVIALVSGGKDSFYAHLHTLALGHNVVALANLHPPFPAPPPESANSTNQDPNPNHAAAAAAAATDDPSAPDLNSHMYQTAGHALIPLYAQALDLPLFRAPITGSAVARGKDYHHHAATTTTKTTNSHATSTTCEPDAETEDEDEDEDETEALVPLLRAVMAAHPNANALVSGAILSTYQRTRVESVCLRLGLTPLAWLWQYPSLPGPGPVAAAATAAANDPSSVVSRKRGTRQNPAQLLLDIADAGLEARIVKVASGGLDESVLWTSLADGRGRGRVERAVARFGGSVLGEGGEFETLVLSGPRGVWKGRLVVEDEDRVVVGGEGGEWGLGFRGGRVEELREEESEVGKGGSESASAGGWRRKIRTPGLWDFEFAKLRDELRGIGNAQPLLDRASTDLGEKVSTAWNIEPVITRSKDTLRISNIVSSQLGQTDNSDVKAEMASICSKIRNILSDYGCTADDAVFTTILLRSMSDFPTINPIYGALFAKPNPPARATVACGTSLPLGTNIILSAVVDLTASEHREGLHVQSRSYWAPANIGPYSQARFLQIPAENQVKLVFVAGQIPLVPSTMEQFSSTDELDDGNGANLFASQALLAAQHLWRIGLVTGVSWWTGAVAYMAYEQSIDIAQARARTAWEVWRRLHKRPKNDEDEDEDDADAGPDIWDRTYGGQGSMSADEVSQQLPDWNCMAGENDGDSSEDALVPGFFAAEVEELPRSCTIEWLASGLGLAKPELGQHMSVSVHTATEAAAEIVDVEVLDAQGNKQKITYMAFEYDQEAAKQWIPTQIQAQSESKHNSNSTTASQSTTHAVVFSSQPEAFLGLNVQIIPCHRVWGSHGRKLQAGLVIYKNM